MSRVGSKPEPTKERATTAIQTQEATPAVPQSRNRHVVCAKTANIASEGNFSYRINDLHGRLLVSMETKALQTVQVPVQNLRPAVYLLVVNDNEDRKTYRFSKQP